MIICVYIIFYTPYIIILARLTSKEIKQVLALCRVSFKDRVAARRSLEEGEILKMAIAMSLEKETGLI